MSYTVLGSTWTPKTALEHAQNMLDAINVSLAPLNITLVPALSNVIWLICLGVGAIASVFDQTLAVAKDSFDISLCDDDQILNLLPIAGTSLLPGTYSSLVVQFTATSGGSLVVPTGTHVKIANQTALFLVSTGATVPASTTVSFDTVCDTLGPINVAASQVTGINETLTNFGSVANSAAAIAGSDQETVGEVRARLLLGETTLTTVNGFRTALLALPGITDATVWFNYSPDTNLDLGVLPTLEPRTLYITLIGSSTEIAETYSRYMLAPTQGTGVDPGTWESQNFTTLSGQAVDVFYTTATAFDIYVNIYVSNTDTLVPGYGTQIKEMVAALSSEVLVGKPVTQEFILAHITDTPYAVVTGAEVSIVSNESGMGRIAVVPVNRYARILAANVDVILET